MNEVMKAKYNSLYQTKEQVFRAGKPIEAVQFLSQYVPSGSVLDLGAGQGANALCLAEQGFAVVAIDVAEVGLEQLAAAAERQGLMLETIVQDITETEIAGEYDAIVCTYVLHHLPEEQAIAVLANAKAKIRPGGVFVLVTFTDEGDLAERSVGKGRFYPSRAALESVYADWQILECTESEERSLATDKVGNPLRNQVITLIAQKPA